MPHWRLWSNQITALVHIRPGRTVLGLAVLVPVQTSTNRPEPGQPELGWCKRAQRPLAPLSETRLRPDSLVPDRQDLEKPPRLKVVLLFVDLTTGFILWPFGICVLSLSGCFNQDWWPARHRLLLSSRLLIVLLWSVLRGAASPSDPPALWTQLID